MSIIITKDGKNAQKINPSDFGKERHLQQYIYDNPDAIPLYDISEDIRLLILAREFPTKSGPIDAIGTDRDGNIYLVETKLYRNPDKRTVVAQVLDYGASLWRSGGSFNEFIALLDEASREQFSVPILQELQEFFSVSEEEASGILENMAKNLDGGNFKFVVLMDKLHGQLKDLIIFINQNSKFDLYAVELEYYKYEEHEIVIPRLFGAEVKKDIKVSSGAGKQWTEELFLQDSREKNDEKTCQIITDLYEFTKQSADVVEWGRGQEKGTFTFKLRHPDSKSGVISLIDVRSNGTITFRFGNITKRLGKEITANSFNKPQPLKFIKDRSKEGALTSDWGTGGPISEVLPDQKSIQALKTAILDFTREVRQSS